MTAKQRRSPWEFQVHGLPLSFSLSLWLVAWVNETCIIVAREAETRSDIVASSKIVAPLLVLDRARSRADLERNSLPNFDSIFRFTRRRRRGRSLWRSLKEEENSFPIFIFRFARHSRDFSVINDHEPEEIDLYFDKERGFVRSKYLTRFHSGKSKEDRENFLIGETVLPPRPFVERELRGKNLQIFLKRKKKKKLTSIRFKIIFPFEKLDWVFSCGIIFAKWSSITITLFDIQMCKWICGNGIVREFIEVIETNKERRLKKFLFHDWIIPMLD